MKKTILIISILVALLILVTIGWYLFLGGNESPVGETIRDVLPFGSGENFVGVPVIETPSASMDIGPDSQFNELAATENSLFRLSDSPVAGFVLISRNNQNVVRYIDRATGHISESLLPREPGGTLGRERITNNTLPKIYEAHFRQDGGAVLVRTLRDDTDLVENTTLVLTPPQATSTEFYSVSANPLRGNLSSIAVGQGNSIFYFLRDSSAIVTSTFLETNSRTIFNSTFTDWKIHSIGANLLIHTKPSALASGYAYSLNSSNGAYTKILGPFNSLVVKPNQSGSRMVYSYTEGGIARMFAINSQGNILDELLPTSLAEKCVWSEREVNAIFCGAPINGVDFGEQDNWHRGSIRFSDRIWKFDTELKTSRVLLDPEIYLDLGIDVYQPKLTSDENYLVFINKGDMTLWALRLLEL